MERKLLTREDVLERLRELWEALALDKGELPEALEDLIGWNITLGQLFVKVVEVEDLKEVRAIGFGAGDDGEDVGDEEDEE